MLQRLVQFQLCCVRNSGHASAPCPISVVLSKELGTCCEAADPLYSLRTRHPSPWRCQASPNLTRFTWGPERGWRFVSEAHTCSLLVNVCAVTATDCGRRLAGVPGTKLVKVCGSIAVLSAFHFGPLASGEVPPHTPR